MDDTGCTVAGVVAMIVTAVSVRISSSVEIVEAGMFSSNGLWVGLNVTSESLARLLALLAIIWLLATVSMPSLLKIRAGFGKLFETVQVVPAFGVV